MKSLILRIILVVGCAIFAGMPTAQAVAGPANVEYGYEPISGIGNDTPPDAGAAAVSPESGSNSSSAVETESSGPGFFGIIASSWVLILVLAAVALSLGWLAWKRRQDGASGMVPRLVALLAIFVALPLVAFGTAQSAKRSPAPKGFFGVITQTDFTSEDSARMARGGVESLRIPLSWADVQPNSGTEFYWESTDQLVGQAAKSGLTTLPFIYSSPKWVTGSITIMPVNGSGQQNAWTNFVKAAVNRYGPDGSFWAEHGPGTADPITPKPVKTWQIWNEANFFYFATPVSPKNYVTLLKLADQAIGEADPSAKIMASGLYGSPPKKEIKKKKAMNSYVFLKQVYALGGKPYFDAAAVHPYTPNTRSTKKLLNKFRGVMIKNRDRKTPLNITEVGWGSARKGFLDVGSPKAQAKQVKSAYKYFLGNRRKLNLKSVYWFAWKDKKRSEVSCNFCYSTGWFKAADGLKPKPSWRQFTKFSGGKP